MTPIISFVIPVFCIEDTYMKKCIESLVSIKATDVEFLFIDDGSPDDSGKLCDEYGEKDSRIKVIHKKNEGVSATRNLGIDMAEGEYISFVDADDWIDSNKMDEVINYVRKKDYDYYLFGHYLEYVNRRIEYNPFPNNHAFNNQRDLVELMKMVFIRAYGSMKTNMSSAVVCGAADKVIRKELLLKHNIVFDREMIVFEDALFSLEVICQCSNAYYISICPYHYRMRRSSATHDCSKKESFSIIQEYEKKARDLLTKYNAPEIVMKSLYYRCFDLIFEYAPRIDRDMRNQGYSIYDRYVYFSRVLNKDLFDRVKKELNTKDLGIKDKFKALLLKHNAISLFLMYKKLRGGVLHRYEEEYI